MSPSKKVKKEIGTRIKKARERIGLSQEELGFAVGKSQDAISAYENGTRGIQSADLPVFAKTLDVPIAYFFGSENPEEEMLAIFERLSPEYREIAMRVLHALEDQQRIS